ITDAVGEHSNLFRPPWGARRPAVFRIVRQLGLEPIMWNITGYDWNAPTAEYIYEKVSPKIRGRDVVLLHDGGHAAFGTDRSSTVTLLMIQSHRKVPLSPVSVRVRDDNRGQLKVNAKLTSFSERSSFG